MQLGAHTFVNGGRIRRKRPTGRGRQQPTLAERADRYVLYQKAVQDPEGDVVRVRRMYERIHGSTPRTLREDFCGTAAFAAAWVKAHRENRAIGVDLDPDPLDWGRRHNLDKLRPEQASRISLLQEDVRTARTRPVWITSASVVVSSRRSAPVSGSICAGSGATYTPISPRSPSSPTICSQRSRSPVA